MQYAESETPPAQCAVCEEERQYVPPRGQTWTTLPALSQSHMNAWREYDTGIIGIGSTPQFAIGQRALLLRSKGGNILWDCVATLDAATVTAIKGLGGLKAIAISHPHFYTTMVEWAHAFDCPVHLHGDDRQWIMRPDPAIKLWDGDALELWGGVTLIRCGGHFPGGTVLHWQDKASSGAPARGIVCAGDILAVTTDRKWLSFMRSYPNFIPLSVREVKAIGAAMAPYVFDVLYGHYFDRVIARDAKAVLEKSIARYVAAVEGTRGYA
jgi:glyoxylase-like metal-dependent hydrolase (beta-lactamase superfamily II)